VKKALFVFMAIFAIAAYADEGMWMPQQMSQIAAELQKAGIKIDPSRLTDLTGDPMGAVISLGGCTASFVSPDGLVVTNHHCAFGSIQFNSTPQRDLLKNGFLARTREEELPAGPGSRVFVTTKIEDVTPLVTGKLSPKLGDVERAKAIETNTKTLVSECEKPGGVRCRVASFFEGSQYLQMTQMEIRDVRLVYAPAEGIGNFGGETDNWMWPRHTGDWSFYRAYVGKDGKPADPSKDNVAFHPAHYLKVAQTGIKPGDFVMVAGYPGRTSRYRTEFEVQQAKDFSLPTTIRYYTDLSKILSDLGANNRQTQIRNAPRIRGFDNTLKNYAGTLSTLNKGTILQQRHQREADLAVFLASHPDAAKKYAGVMDKINKLDKESAATRERDAVLGMTVRSSPLLSQASRLYRYSVEKAKKDLDRSPGYQERDVPMLQQSSARAQSSIDLPSDRAGLRYMLIETTKLPAGQRIAPIDAALAKTGKSGTEAVDALLDQLYANTKLADLEARKAMLGETTAQLEARNDAMINLAAALYPLDKAIEDQERQVTGAMSRVRPLYMEALREMTGGKLYPDANSTLRITFGNVKGYSPKDGVWYEPQTTVFGVLQKDTGSGEFDSPKNLLAAISAKKFGPYGEPQIGGAVSIDFLSNVDTTGGNSGSPTLNANGELCGLLFDGTWESRGSDFLTDANTRSIHVDAQYMLWVMDAVDGAHNLLQEMGITPKF
jgi:hypothetical protein